MKNLFCFLALATLHSAVVAQLPPVSAEPEVSPPSALTDEEKAAGWKLIFDGRNNYGLRGLTFNDFINRGWKIDHGTLYCRS